MTYLFAFPLVLLGAVELFLGASRFANAEKGRSGAVLLTLAFVSLVVGLSILADHFITSRSAICRPADNKALRGALCYRVG